MRETRSPSIERQCDVAIVGGSAAGLGAALQLGRQRRSVIVIDAGAPRNEPATQMHSYLGRDGIAPGDFAVIAREEVREYGIEVLTGRAVDVTRGDDDRFRVELSGGHTVVARRVIAATGVVDELPAIDGLADRWGIDAIHCPFCHGYEVRDRRVVQIVTHTIGLHSTGFFRQLTEHFTMVLHEGVDAGDSTVEALRAAGVSVLDGPVRRVLTGERSGATRLTGVELADGTVVDADAVAIGTRFRIRIAPFESLGLTLVAHATGLGDVVETDHRGETSVPGVYAVGNVTDPVHQMLQAAAHGGSVGGMVAHSLAQDDIAAAQRPSGNRADWERRYDTAQVWSGNPNGTLVNEVASLTPRRALDVGAGEGGDAVWLAEHGWNVAAADIAQGAVDRIATVAIERGLAIEAFRADANAVSPFEAAAFDLVTAHYASIPRTPDGRGVANVLAAVAPGGTLLVVGHDPAPMRSPIDTSEHSRAFDPDAYVGVDDFVDAVRDDASWHMVSHDKRPRPVGAATSSHHVDDVVIRAYRLAT